MPFQKGNTLASKGQKKASILKKQQWATMGEMLTTRHTLKMQKYMEDLWLTDKKEFAATYLNLLNYFKPKLGSQLIRSQSEIIIKVVNPEDNKDITEEI